MFIAVFTFRSQLGNIDSSSTEEKLALNFLFFWVGKAFHSSVDPANAYLLLWSIIRAQQKLLIFHNSLNASSHMGSDRSKAETD